MVKGERCDAYVGRRNDNRVSSYPITGYFHSMFFPAIFRPSTYKKTVVKAQTGAWKNKEFFESILFVSLIIQ